MKRKQATIRRVKGSDEVSISQPGSMVVSQVSRSISVKSIESDEKKIQTFPLAKTLAQANSQILSAKSRKGVTGILKLLDLYDVGGQVGAERGCHW